MGLHRGEDSTLSRVEEVLVNDGEWHHLQLDISSLGGAASLHKAVLSLDQGLYLVSHGVPGSEGGLRVRHQFGLLLVLPAASLLHISSRPAWRSTGSCETPR